ncbi:MAG: undecaprenyl-diphosphate phosphatase [Pseudomonadales bacterium]|nr:undecaprenyl-diphosphate phosphatase [Pseudomonadales bacterium]
MEWLQIITLALIQGVTEFLPISSSAHLILPALLTDWPDQGLAFDVAVHVGSLGAVLVYFRRDMAAFAAGGWQLIRHRALDEDGALLLRLALATLPIVIAGFLLKDWVESTLRTVPVIAWATIVFGLLLWYADRRPGERSVPTWRDAIVIGLMQVIALMPGTSRSGITITAALLVGLSRAAGARFAFLLAIPTIGGAGVLMALDVLEAGVPDRWLPLLAGATIAGVSAYACIRAFIALIDRTGMTPYVVYRMFLGGLLLALWYGQRL